MLLKIISGTLLLLGITSIILGIRNRELFTTGLILFATGALLTYLPVAIIQSYMPNFGVNYTIPMVPVKPGIKYSISFITPRFNETTTTYYVTEPGKTIHVYVLTAFGEKLCGNWTIIGPDIQKSFVACEAIFKVSTVGTYSISFLRIVNNSIVLSGGVVIVKKSINWLVDSLLSFWFAILQALSNVVTQFLQPFYTAFAIDALYLTPEYPSNFESLYKQIQYVSMYIAVFALAIYVAYMAIFYGRTLMDWLVELIHDIGLWILGTFYSIQIYNIITGFFNYLILNCLNYPALMTSTLAIFSSSLTGFLLTTILDVLIPTSSFPGLRTLLIIPILTIMLGGFIRVVIIYTLISLMPLIMVLWILPYTRGIANSLISLLTWAVLLGPINAVTIIVMTQLMNFYYIGIALLVTLLPIVYIILFIACLSALRGLTGRIRKVM